MPPPFVLHPRAPPSHPAARPPKTGPFAESEAHIPKGPFETEVLDKEEDLYEPTTIQKADLLITQQWLRLTVWKSSLRQLLLSRNSPYKSMRLTFPLVIAHRTASILKTLPETAIEAHGIGIFEKIFEIGRSWIEVLNVHVGTGSPVSSKAPVFGMDFTDARPGSDLGVLGVGRIGVAIDPLEFFLRILSLSPVSRAQFADQLSQLAQEMPAGLRLALSPAIRAPALERSEANQSSPLISSGRIIGEVAEDEEVCATSPFSKTAGSVFYPCDQDASSELRCGLS